MVKTTFSIHQVEKPLNKQAITKYYETEHLDDTVLKLERKGIVFDSLSKNQDWLWREARLKDLDGNPIILFYAGENRKNPPWRIT